MTSPAIQPAGATEGCRNPIIGGGGTLVYPSIHSPNFSAGPPIVGWSINKDGTVQLAGTIEGNYYILNNAGFFLYSGVPAAGNLIVAIASAPGTDAFGNAYLMGPGALDGGGGRSIMQGGGVFVGRVTDFAFGGMSVSTAGELDIITDLITGADSSARLSMFSKAGSPNGVPQFQFLTGAGGPPTTSDLVEFEGVIGFKGSDTSLSAPSPAQTLALGTASQLSDLTRDYMLYLSFSGAGNLSISIGPTSATARTILPVTALAAGALYPVRIPAGWWTKITGTGTVAIASQNVVGC